MTIYLPGGAVNRRDSGRVRPLYNSSSIDIIFPSATVFKLVDLFINIGFDYFDWW